MVKIIIALYLAFFSMTCFAADLLVDTFLAQQELSSQVAMYVNDATNKNYVQSARASKLKLDELVASVAKENASIAAALLQAWTLEETALDEGLLKNGYDARSHMEYTTRQRELSHILKAAIGRRKESTLSAIEIADVVAQYLLITTSPTGTFDVSFTDSGTDFSAQVARINILMAALVKPGKDSIKDTKLKSIQTKWAFLRTALLKADRQSAPFIVNYTGSSLVNALLKL